MQKPLVVFGIASYTGAACHEFQQSMIETMAALGAAGIPSHCTYAPGDPYLSKARNGIASDFLRNFALATHLFFIDDDVGWPGAKVVEFVRRDLDVIGGVYPKKSDNPEWPMQLDLGADGLPIERAGLLRVMLAPTGFLCIKRGVIERMAATSGQYLNTVKQVNPDLHWNIFDMGCFMPDGTRPAPGQMAQFWGEDYYFCRRWRDMGGEIWIDPDITFSHRGPKAWIGNIKPSIDAWVEQKRAVAAQPEAAE